MSDTVRRLTAALADRYRLDRELGAGGMATVYLAHDLKHERDVAIKVLHPDLGAALGGERFLTEIRTTARLQHPHILPLLDSGEADGLLYYVMPLVTGETLRARLERERQLPIADAIRIAREVASALDYAHRQNVIHRDIKPENILLHDGSALVADFGIALAVQSAGGQRMTQTGLSLGTPQYMSPEQAMGERTIDARSDIYALGAVTYEMLTGEAPFIGNSVQAIVARVLTEEPRSIRVQRKAVPAGVEQAVMRALEKLPADRFESAGAFAAALGDQAFIVGGSADARARGTARGAPWKRATVAMAATAALFAISTVGLWRARTPMPATRSAGVIRFPLVATDSLRLEPRSTTPFAISPDGRTIVFGAQGADGRYGLWVRALDDARARRLDNTDDAANPAISPDGESVAFVSENNTIRRMRLSGGSVTTVTTVDGGTASLAWLTADTLLFETLRGTAAGIQRVGVYGGTPATLIPVDSSAGELVQRRPFMLRREGLVLFASTDSAGVDLVAYSLADGRRRRLGIAGLQALGLVDGHLVYSRADGSLMAVAFDPSTMRTSGTPRELRERVYAWAGGTNVMCSEGGTLVYRPAEQPRATLMLVDTLGRSRPLGADVGSFLHPRFSPNGRQVVAARASVDASGGEAKSDLWLFDRSSGEGTRLTNTGTATAPEWMPDGKRVAWIARTARGGQLWVLPLDRSAEPKRLYDGQVNLTDAAFTRDGKGFVGVTVPATGPRELARYALDPQPAARVALARAPVGSRGRPYSPRISPDGRWVMHTEFGQVYLRPIDGSSAIEVDRERGADAAAWGPDSRSIYYSTGDGLMVAELQVTPSLAIVRRRRVGVSTMSSIDFDLSPDGTTFVAVQSNTTANPLVVVGWTDDVRGMLRGKAGGSPP